MLKFIYLIIILYLHYGIFANTPFKGTNAIISSNYIYEPKDVSFPSCHASTITETKTGLMAAWFGGTEERAPDVCIYTSSSTNGKWSIPEKVADGIQGATSCAAINTTRFVCIPQTDPSPSVQIVEQ